MATAYDGITIDQCGLGPSVGETFSATITQTATPATRTFFRTQFLPKKVWVVNATSASVNFWVDGMPDNSHIDIAAASVYAATEGFCPCTEFALTATSDIVINMDGTSTVAVAATEPVTGFYFGTGPRGADNNVLHIFAEG